MRIKHPNESITETLEHLASQPHTAHSIPKEQSASSHQKRNPSCFQFPKGYFYIQTPRNAHVLKSNEPTRLQKSKHKI